MQEAANQAIPHLWHYAGAGIGLGRAVIGAGIGIGKLAAGMADGIARQPSPARRTWRCSCSKASPFSRSSSAC